MVHRTGAMTTAFAARGSSKAQLTCRQVTTSAVVACTQATFDTDTSRTGRAKPLEMWPLKWEVPQTTLNLNQVSYIACGRRCPVLTQRLGEPAEGDVQLSLLRHCRCSEAVDADVASGSEVRAAADPDARAERERNRWVLVATYAMPRTGISYGILSICYAMSGTDVGYRGTRKKFDLEIQFHHMAPGTPYARPTPSPVLTHRMGIPGPQYMAGGTDGISVVLRGSSYDVGYCATKLRGTEIGYGATRLVKNTSVSSPLFIDQMLNAICGTEIAYGGSAAGIRLCNARY
eukprot:3006107-Rhodomonas_salina.1